MTSIKMKYLLALCTLTLLTSCAKHSSPTQAQPQSIDSVHGYWLIEADTVARGLQYMIYVDTGRNSATDRAWTFADSVAVLSIDSVSNELRSLICIGRIEHSTINLMYFPTRKDSLLASFEYHLAADSDVHILEIGGQLSPSGMIGTVEYQREWPSALNHDYYTKATTNARLATQAEVDRLIAVRVGNGNSHIFHEWGCRYVTDGLVNPVYFWNRDSALANGYSPDVSGACTP
jgi:hypothetical protein